MSSWPKLPLNVVPKKEPRRTLPRFQSSFGIKRWDSIEVAQANTRTSRKSRFGKPYCLSETVCLHVRWCTKVAMSFWLETLFRRKRLWKASGATFDTRIYKAGLASIEYALESDWWEEMVGSFLLVMAKTLSTRTSQ